MGKRLWLLAVVVLAVVALTAGFAVAFFVGTVILESASYGYTALTSIAAAYGNIATSGRSSWSLSTNRSYGTQSPE